MEFEFELTRRNYSIEIDEDRFIHLLDSESHVSGNAAFGDGNQTLCEKLDGLPGVFNVEYDGHFGAAIYLAIDAEDDTDELKREIGNVIDAHLKWCRKVAKRRKDSTR